MFLHTNLQCLMTQKKIREHISAVESCLGELANVSGEVLYNGWGTLREGLVYLMGFNPGGKPEQITASILDSIRNMPDSYCSYEDAVWEWGGIDQPKGQHPHQKRVKEVTALLGLNVRSVFAANAIFQRSETANTLREALRLWERCWPVHQIFLKIVKPKIIICLGNGPRSSFSLLQAKLGSKSDITPCAQSERKSKFLNGKEFRGSLFLDGLDKPLNCLVIGIPHPSRFQMSEELKIYLTPLVSG